MHKTYKGGCACRAVRFSVDAPVTACVTCHCDSCRRQCASPMATYIGTNDGDWRWLAGTPAVFASSAGVQRCFCADCGTPLTFASDKLSGVMHFYLACLDDPNAFAPTLHVAAEERLAWLKLSDDLPSHIGPDYRR